MPCQARRVGLRRDAVPGGPGERSGVPRPRLKSRRAFTFRVDATRRLLPPLADGLLAIAPNGSPREEVVRRLPDLRARRLNLKRAWREWEPPEPSKPALAIQLWPCGGSRRPADHPLRERDRTQPLSARRYPDCMSGPAEHCGADASSSRTAMSLREPTRAACLRDPAPLGPRQLSGHGALY